MRTILAAAFTAFLALPALAQDVPVGNVEGGARIFNQCRACHSINEGGRNGVGPNLHRVVDRAAGSIANFNYSPNMREKAAGGLVWNEVNLRSYLANPKVLLPQGRMSYPGLGTNEQGLSDVIAYLRQQGGN